MAPAAPRRGAPRGLTAAERALWHDWARRTRVAPLAGKVVEPAPLPVGGATPAQPSPAVGGGPAFRPPPAGEGRGGASAHRQPELHVGGAPAGLDDRRWRDLRRGRTRPERTLDLHGYRAQQAHAAVRAFLRDAVADGLRCVAIVTGRGSSPEGGVLRRELPHWLNAPELRPLVLGAAHPHAANAGAVHLLLRQAHRAAAIRAAAAAEAAAGPPNQPRRRGGGSGR